MVTAADTARFLARKVASERQGVAEREAAMRLSLPGLVDVLLGRHGARRVWLFGSLAWGRVDARSDIDLAVEGLEAAAYLPALADLLDAAPVAVDLVRLEEAPETLRARVVREGRLVGERQD